TVVAQSARSDDQPFSALVFGPKMLCRSLMPMRGTVVAQSARSDDQPFSALVWGPEIVGLLI
ncbi:MAG: hypothetical protein Q4A13_02365, partial [Fretibacterium sp.]|nr:hypothetical protein [Fretibacterium sp.]